MLELIYTMICTILILVGLGICFAAIEKKIDHLTELVYINKIKNNS